MSTLASQICNQVASVFSKPSPSPPPLDLMVDEISAASARKARIFLYGVGREGLMLKALCMRLAHLGLSAHSVFDMTTPPISSPDLLISSAGPGAFSTVDAICRVALSNGARVLLLTAQPGTGSPASVIAHVPAQTVARQGLENLGRCFRWGACSKGLCLFCLRWWCFDWGRFWVRALRPSDLVIRI